MDEWDEGEAAISDVLRIELVASEQGFNGTVPGPTIEAAVGETLVVRLINQLPVSAGFHIGCTSDEAARVLPGQAREYRVVLTSEGTFQYCGCTDGKGLCGVLRVWPAER